jgi:DNA-binding transcriptional ArsR family regulator
MERKRDMAGEKRKAAKRNKIRPDVDPTDALLKALNHPVRAQALAILANGIASPTELADRLDQPLGNISYHVRVLEELGLVEIAAEEAVRGSMAHYFKYVEHDPDDGRPVPTPLRMDRAGWATVRRIQARARKEILKEQAAAQCRTNGSQAAATVGFIGHFLLEVPPEELGDTP